MSYLLSVLISLFFLQNNLHAQDHYTEESILKDGSNFQSIGKAKQLPSAALKALNPNLKEPFKKGQLIKLPTDKALAKAYVIHTVSDQDKSLWRLCQTYKHDVDEILDLNYRTSSGIRTGERLFFPKKVVLEEVFALQNTKTVLDSISTDSIPSSNDSLAVVPKKAAPTGSFQLSTVQAKFPYEDRGEWAIFTSIKTGLSNFYPLEEATVTSFFAEQTANSQYYFYSVEPDLEVVNTMTSTVIDSSNQDSIITTKVTKNQSTYYDFITVIEVNTEAQSFALHPIFIKKGKKDPKQAGKVLRAPKLLLASQKNTEKQRIEQFSKRLSSSVIKHSKRTTTLEAGEATGTVTEVTILQVYPDQAPDILDTARYENGKLLKDFKDQKRKKALNY